MAAKTSRRQRKTIGRVMHEYKHGELKSGGRKKVKSRKQAVAIALNEARRSGAKVAPKKGAKKSSSRKKSATKKKSTSRKSTKKSSRKS